MPGSGGKFANLVGEQFIGRFPRCNIQTIDMLSSIIVKIPTATRDKTYCVCLVRRRTVVAFSCIQTEISLSFHFQAEWLAGRGAPRSFECEAVHRWSSSPLLLFIYEDGDWLKRLGAGLP